MTDINPNEEECIVTQEEILEFLQKTFPEKEEIQHFIESINKNRKSSIYKEFCFDKEHKIMAIILDFQSPLIIFKDIENKQFCKSYLAGVEEVSMDQNRGVYFVRSNDLERKCFLMHHKIDEVTQEGFSQEKCVYEEKNLNYELKGLLNNIL